MVKWRIFGHLALQSLLRQLASKLLVPTLQLQLAARGRHLRMGPWNSRSLHWKMTENDGILWEHDHLQLRSGHSSGMFIASRVSDKCILKNVTNMSHG